ncbi:leishmanolysin-related zinc metalloendopeptidase, partial [Gemmatimonadota bacterium]
WTLGTTSGTQTLTATVSDVTPATISATAEPGTPVGSLVASGADQTATVGTGVSTLPAVKVEDSYGNGVPGVAVVFAETSSPAPPGGAEVVTGASTQTDANGIATVGGWTLGTAAGSYELTAFISGLGAPVTFTATAEADVASAISKHQGDNQSAQTGQAVGIPPSVMIADQYGNPVEGIGVTFAVGAGGGTATGLTATSAADGTAAVGSWTLGASVGGNSLIATAGDLGSVTFNASALNLVPAAIVKVAGDNQSVMVGTGVPTLPKVRVTDASAIPIPGASVTFSVTSGGGTITAGVANTNASGEATVGSWILGTTTGTNTLSVITSGVAPATFTAIGTAGSAATLTKNAGDAQSAVVSTAVSTPPSVKVMDQYGNGVPGVTVLFAVASGGGSVTAGSAVSNSSGIAQVGSWTLGPTPGANTLTASSTGLNDITFTAMGTVAPTVGGFAIELQFMTSVTPAQQAVFEAAVTRWQQVITGDVPDWTLPLVAGGCQPVSEAGPIDDVKIYITVTAIDGVGGVLGQAGPCYYRLGTPFPITGIMRLDVDDINSMLASGMLQDVIIHEMGHILGIGTFWNTGSNSFLVGDGTSDPYFNGPNAIAAFNALGGSGRTGTKVPVEALGGSGTAYSHWRESVHNNELMTGWISPPGVPNPLSGITVGSLQDMGYVVDMGAADSYFVPFPGAALLFDNSAKIFLRELPPPKPIPIGMDGIIRRSP